MSIWKIQPNFVLAGYKFALYLFQNNQCYFKWKVTILIFLQFLTFMFDAIIEGLNYHCWYQTKWFSQKSKFDHMITWIWITSVSFQIIVKQIFVEITIFKPLLPATFMIIFGLLVLHFARDGELKPERGCECFMQT